MSKAIVNQHQPSITEWFALIGEKEKSEQFRLEDNRKVERLEFLFQTIGLPYERPIILEATEISNYTDNFQKILKDKGQELCAIRLVPKKESLPKIRNRGLTLKECYETWYLKQDINPKDYTAYICPHVPDVIWSSIFVVNQDKIFGEIIAGGHGQLTQGNTTHDPIDFQFDFQNWSWTEEDQDAAFYVLEMMKLIKVNSQTKRETISTKLGVDFTKHYLNGYFETVVWPDGKLHFIDYNRMLPSLIPSPIEIPTKQQAILTGKIAYPGHFQGKVVRVHKDKTDKIRFASDSVLVCENTDVRFLPLMKKAGAIVTDQGGLLSHAAIMARELKKTMSYRHKSRDTGTENRGRDPG